MLKATLGVLALCASGTVASATLIDFETFPGGAPVADGTRITNQYASLGVTIFQTTDPLGPQIVQFGFAGQSGVNALGGAGGAFDFFQPINVSFSPAVTFASILALDVGENGLIVEAFSGSTLVDSQTVTGAGRDVGVGFSDLMSVSFGGGFDQLVIRQVTPGAVGDGFGIDDLNFTQIPTPGAAGLLGLGLLAGLRRRR